MCLSIPSRRLASSRSSFFSFPRVPATKVGEPFEAGNIPAFDGTADAPERQPPAHPRRGLDAPDAALDEAEGAGTLVDPLKQPQTLSQTSRTLLGTVVKLWGGSDREVPATKAAVDAAPSNLEVGTPFVSSARSALVSSYLLNSFDFALTTLLLPRTLSF